MREIAVVKYNTNDYECYECGGTSDAIVESITIWDTVADDEYKDIAEAVALINGAGSKFRRQDNSRYFIIERVRPGIPTDINSMLELAVKIKAEKKAVKLKRQRAAEKRKRTIEAKKQDKERAAYEKLKAKFELETNA